MKKLTILFCFVMLSFLAKAQFTSMDSLRNYINTYIRNSAVQSFQNLRLNTALNQILNYIDSAAVGTGATINLNKTTAFTQITITPSGGGTSVIIDSATASRSGVLTVSSWLFLDSLHRGLIALGGGGTDTAYLNATGWLRNHPAPLYFTNGPLKGINDSTVTFIADSANLVKNVIIRTGNLYDTILGTEHLIGALSSGGGVTDTTALMRKSNNLADVSSASASRTNLGLGTAAIKNVPASGNAASTETVLGSDTRLTDSRAPNGTASGDLGNSYPNPTVTGIKGTALPSLSAGLLRWNGSAWVFDASTFLTGNQSITFTPGAGDVTGSASGATSLTPTLTIGSNVVTNAKAAQMAAHTHKGNNTGSTANAIDLTNTQLTADLNLFGTTTQGLVPAPGSVSGKVLSDNGTWITASGGGITDTTALMRKANNLADVANVTNSRTNLGAARKLNKIGLILNSNSFTAGDWTFTGTGSFSVTGGKILLSGGNQTIGAGNNSAFNGTLKYTKYGSSLLEAWKMVVKFKITSTLSSSTSGICSGLISTNSLGAFSNAMGYANTTNGTSAGVGALVLGTSNTNVISTPRPVVYNLNDYYIMTTERKYDRMYVTIRNATTDSASATAVYSYDPTNSSGVLLPNTGMFGFANMGGSITIDSIAISSDILTNADLVIVGDSKISGYSTRWDKRAVSLLEPIYVSVYGDGGPSDATADVKARLPELTGYIKPKQVLLAIARNDTAFGVAPATWRQNYKTIDSTLTAAGISVIHTDGIYENQFILTTVRNYIDQTYPNTIKTYDAGNIAGSVSFDNVHPSILGAQIFAQTVAQSGKIVNYSEAVNVNSLRNQDIETFDSIKTNFLDMNYSQYVPSKKTATDIILNPGAAIRSAFGSNTQESEIIPFNGGFFDMANYYGAGDGLAFRWYGAASSTGGHNLLGGITASGKWLMGPNSIVHSQNVTGDASFYIGTGVTGSVANLTGYFGKISPFVATGNTEYENQFNTGQHTFFVSNGTMGGRVSAFVINANKTLTASAYSSGSEISVDTTNDKVAVFDASGNIKRMYWPAGGGMSNPLTTTGDIIYSSSGTTPARLGIGSTNQVLTVIGGVPSWQNSASGFSNPMTTNGDLISQISGSAARLAAGTQAQALRYNGTNLIWRDTLPVTGVYALLASPTFTGTPAAPTAAQGTNTTQIATSAYVERAAGFSNTVISATGSLTLSQSKNNNIQIDPASSITYTLTMPASPNNGDMVMIWAGGTIAVSSAVVTSFTLSPNTGQTIYGAAPATLNGGDALYYIYSSSSTRWQRLKF